MVKKSTDLAVVQKKAVAFATEWLSENAVLPKGVDADEAQFSELMATVVRALAQAYAAGYLERQR